MVEVFGSTEFEYPAMHPMRIRILKRPPDNYSEDTQSLMVGRIYNLDASLASALLLEGCAEMYDVLTDDEKRDRTRTDLLWEAAERGTRFLTKP